MTISVTELKARCLEIIRNVERNERSSKSCGEAKPWLACFPRAQPHGRTQNHRNGFAVPESSSVRRSSQCSNSGISRPYADIAARHAHLNLVAHGMDFCSQETVEEALGSDLATAIPELLRLTDIEIRIPRMEVVVLERLAALDGETVSAVLARVARFGLRSFGVAVLGSPRFHRGPGVAGVADHRQAHIGRRNCRFGRGGLSAKPQRLEVGQRRRSELCGDDPFRGGWPLADRIHAMIHLIARRAQPTAIRVTSVFSLRLDAAPKRGEAGS